jgi:hypothetical protein
MKTMAEQFAEQSSLQLHDFLAEPLAKRIESGLRDMDAADGLGPKRSVRIPHHDAGSGKGWHVAGPPHKLRYCLLDEGPPNSKQPVTPLAADANVLSQLRSLQDDLIAGPAFRSWLAVFIGLIPLKRTVQARRFRPGLDYTLATSQESEVRLDVVLGLTPSVAPSGAQASADRNNDEDDEEKRDGWASGIWGGWECYMAPHEEDDDPAVYRSGSSKKQLAEPKTKTNGTNGTPSDHDTTGSPLLSIEGHQDQVDGSAPQDDNYEEDGMDSDEDDEDSAPLLTVQPSFNRLLLALRDEGTMHFVKYVSAAAPGSRWDVCAEYEVGMLADSDDDV